MKPPILTAITIAALSAVMSPVQAAFTPEDLKEVEAKIIKLSEKALPCTVSLVPAGNAPRYGSGSGVIVSEDGLILTAAHVAMEMGGRVIIKFTNGDRAEGEVLGLDFKRDAAMIQIDGSGSYPFMDIGKSKGLKRNDWCVSIGHASGHQPDRTPPIRLGRVIENDNEGFLQSDCALIAGDSGGPLFDLDGNVIGIHSNIGFSLSTNNHVPIEVFKDNWDALKAGERFGGYGRDSFLQDLERPMIGIGLGDADGGGAEVRNVLPDSPAQRAGLKRGDVIVKIDNEDIGDSDKLMAVVRKSRAGDSLKLKVVSGEDEKEVELELTSARKLGERGDEGEEGKKGEEGAKENGKRAKSKRGKKKAEKEEEIDIKKLQTEFNRKMREAMENGQLPRDEDFEKFGESLEELMEQFREGMTRGDMMRLAQMAETPPLPRPGDFDPDAGFEIEEKFIREVWDAFRPSVVNASDATHIVFRGNDWKSLCTVVHEDGYVLTKASEIETGNNQKLTVMINKDDLIPAKVIKKWEKYDLALLEMEGSPKLTAVDFRRGTERLPLGSMVSAAGSGPDPLAIGVISVQARTLSNSKRGFLGIIMAPHERGVRIGQLAEEGNARHAGLKVGDVILKVDEEATNTPEKLIQIVGGTEPGQTVTIDYLRNGKELTKKVELVDRARIGNDNVAERAGHMNQMGTSVSRESGGFPNALQTDIPIQPQECGGPLVNLDGEVVGINIARAGRIRTYAIPAEDLRKLLAPELRKIEEREPAAAEASE